MPRRKYDDLSREELIRVLEARDRERATRFGLVWEHDEIERDKALNSDFVALDLVPELSCPPIAPPPQPSPVGPGEGARRQTRSPGSARAAAGTPIPSPGSAGEGQGGGSSPGWKNLIIEGDNFDALRYLKMTFAGRVKCIYIDPPYNTGNRDFIYNDRFVDKEDKWRHSKWCEFMYQRLTLAKDLLTQDGVIFVSIDDNEVGHLRLIMDRIFGEANWISTLVWKKSYGGGSKANHVVGLHEYIHCFAQSKPQIVEITLPPDPKVLKYYKGKDSKFETRGPFRLQPLATNSMDARPNLRYPIPFGGEEIWPEKQWQWSKERTMSALADDGLVIRKRKGSWSVNYKQYLRSDDGDERGSKPYSIVEGPFTQVGTGEVKDIFGDGKAFTFPKPSELVRHLVSYVALDDPNAITLDFFAGSGTTAHAVHKLNKEDGGDRRVILVSSTERTEDEPEKNLCRDVCATRVRRVIEGYGDTPGLGGDFAYLRCRRIPTGKLLEIDHAQVWTALQLTHMPAIAPFDEGRPFAVADDGDQRLIYIPHFRARNAKALAKLVAESPAVIVYTWQADLVRGRLEEAENVQVESIPESLARRFGLRV